jgi:hypothetical protein
VALGSKVLLHVERVSALFALLVAIVSVVREAARGRLPTQLTTAGLAYDVDMTAAYAAQRLQRQFEELQAQVQRLEKIVLGDNGHES